MKQVVLWIVSVIKRPQGGTTSWWLECLAGVKPLHVRKKTLLIPSNICQSNLFQSVTVSDKYPTGAEWRRSQNNALWGELWILICGQQKPPVQFEIRPGTTLLGPLHPQQLQSINASSWSKVMPWIKVMFCFMDINMTNCFKVPVKLLIGVSGGECAAKHGLASAQLMWEEGVTMHSADNQQTRVFDWKVFGKKEWGDKCVCWVGRGEAEEKKRRWTEKLAKIKCVWENHILYVQI